MIGTLILGLIVGAIIGAIIISLFAVDNADCSKCKINCSNCRLRKAVVEAEAKRQKAKVLQEREAFYSGEAMEGLPTHEAIRRKIEPKYNKKHNYVNNKTYK